MHTELEAEGRGRQESLGLKTISACGKEQWGKGKRESETVGHKMGLPRGREQQGLL